MSTVFLPHSAIFFTWLFSTRNESTSIPWVWYLSVPLLSTCPLAYTNSCLVSMHMGFWRCNDNTISLNLFKLYRWYFHISVIVITDRFTNSNRNLLSSFKPWHEFVNLYIWSLWFITERGGGSKTQNYFDCQWEKPGRDANVQYSGWFRCSCDWHIKIGS